MERSVNGAEAQNESQPITPITVPGPSPICILIFTLVVALYSVTDAILLSIKDSYYVLSVGLIITDLALICATVALYSLIRQWWKRH